MMYINTNSADDIFEAYAEQPAEQSALRKSWNFINSTSENMLAFTKDHIRGVMESASAQIDYSKKLWNLTLLQ